MRAAPPTAVELRALVDDLLANPDVDVPDDSGLDDETAMAIERAWAGGSTPSLDTVARHELELQIDGTHAQEAMDRQAAIFDEVVAQRGDAKPN